MQTSERFNPVKVAVTGAAGAIGYSLLFRIASGQMLGEDTPVELSLLEIPDAVKAAEGVAMELDDCAFPLLAHRHLRRPEARVRRGPGGAARGRAPALEGHGARRPARGERRDLQAAGRGAERGRADDVRVLVVGNPANTNALIAMSNAPDVPRERFTAMTRLDHNRAIAQLANKVGCRCRDVTNMTIWGNHSPTQYPDIFHAKVEGESAAERVDDQAWLENDFIPTGQQARRGDHRGARRLERGVGRQRGHRPRARLDARRRAATGCRWRSPRRLLRRGGGDHLLVPRAPRGGRYEIVAGPRDRRLLARQIDATVDELKEERDAVKELGTDRITA